ncbi:hypothetical protein mflW37_3670 [Mesoplasma florum W37]|uniref:Uncharacterized protein n=1 Tax=Mesoplasma florum TaxID=2151 RepID=A0AAD0HT35_MESFO|nr:hypothetical protein [Mesoplasma florum]AGY41434.1 hypothetical protein mflW37_3670 [Mesoplasma florum W37]AVN59652.1 hypothetical protein CG008_01910 [Mesoplasma florum]AVN65774.1 hypothetical protein MflW12_3690 [Mesoplasma florum]
MKDEQKKCLNIIFENGNKYDISFMDIVLFNDSNKIFALNEKSDQFMLFDEKTKNALRNIENEYFNSIVISYLIFESKKDKGTILNTSYGKCCFNPPKTWYEWWGLVWRLEMDNEFTENWINDQGIISGVLGVISVLFPPIGILTASIALNLAINAREIKKQNKGNGVLIRFNEGAAIIPFTGAIKPCTRKW